MLRQKPKMKRKNSLSFKNQSADIPKIKYLIRKLDKNNIPLFTQSACIGLSKEGQNQFNQDQIHLFSFEEEHRRWIYQYMKSQTQNHFCSIQHIFNHFLTNFQVETNFQRPILQKL
ncbi:unnamed protein product [Paramecium octaurelia]|uniref:Uncharacterized protein n=1 Tax=Paramecium octaurelia TaxID=43137 RepID=A0A8S1WLL4_PAROT|nr:unnamed protein product [Paramecium octaurelia]